MYQVDQGIWNAIQAAHPELIQREWAARLFAMNAAEIQPVLERQMADLKAAGTHPLVVTAFVQVTPLLQEREAIQAFVAEHEELQGALPEVLTVDEAVALGAAEFNLSPRLQLALKTLLEQAQSAPRRRQPEPSLAPTE